ncbi:MAG: hypothetical protein P8020_02170 [Acidobacteriota bacterium]
MRRTTLLTSLFLMASGVAGPAQDSGQEVAELELPSNSQISRIKIFPGQKIYALSYSTARLLVFDVAGNPVRTIDLQENRPVDVKFYFFDFYVDAAGKAYVLAVWRPRGNEIRSGVFEYGADGEFVRLVPFDKHVDGRRLVVDAEGNLLVLGLDTDLYFGRADRLGLAHRYDSEGRYLGAFLTLDWEDYAPPATPSIQAAYHTLRPLVDRLPLSIDETGRVATVLPGTTTVMFFGGKTLASRSSAELPVSPIALTQLPPPGGRFTGETEQIIKLQVNRDRIIAEVSEDRRFQGPPTIHTGRALQFFERSESNRLLHAEPSTPEFGTLVEQVGTPTDDIYCFSIRQGRPTILRRLSPRRW